KKSLQSTDENVERQGARLSTVEQTASGLQSAVYNADGSSKVTQLANGLSSTVTNLDWESRITGAERLESDPRFNNWASIPFGRYDINNTDSISLDNPPISAYNTPPPPSGGTRVLRIRHSSPDTAPKWGGVVRSKQSRANQKVVIEFYALVPFGRHLEYSNGELGSGHKSGWITSNEGTGKWERYAYFHAMGSSGDFSIYGFLSLAGGSAPSPS